MSRVSMLAIVPLLSMLTGLNAPAQSSLPFSPTPSASVAKRTMGESTQKRRITPDRLKKDAPNIVIMMLDDVGPALPETYGGEIHTPALNRVANSGIAYNRFHNAAMCSPTRASLLTGRNHHRLGFGQIAELANDWDGYSGSWPATTASVAKVLGAYGYKTAAFGKWHNTPATETTTLGPFERWPVGKHVGFDYFYGFLAGESSQWEPAIVENMNRIETPKRKNYHFTEDMTDKTISWMNKERALTPDKPFLIYWAPGAAHGPHHVAKVWADKYKGKFDAGWDVMRERTFERQKKMGWIPQNTILTPRPTTLAAWKDIPENERAFQLRLMEVFAGFVEHTDTQATRILDELDKLGIRDNTLVIYVWSDNGSSAEGQHGTISELLSQNGIDSKISDHIKALNELGGLDALGGHKTDNMYHAGWAWAGSTPYQATKLVASHFGGTRTPLVVSWPRKIRADKTPRSQFHHVNDIVPTIYEVTGIKPPKTVDGVSQDPMDGVSMLYSFNSAKAPETKKTQYFEIMGSRAIYQDGWIASVFGPRIPWVPGLPQGITSWTPDKDTWELYDLRTDFSQGKDLAVKDPKRVASMKVGFDKIAKAEKVYPIGGGLWSILHPQDAPSNPANEFFYNQHVTEVPEFAGPKLGARSNNTTVIAKVAADSAGVLYALGAFSGGLALWVDQGKIFYEYNLFEIERTLISSENKLPLGEVKIEVETILGKDRHSPVSVTIKVNGEDFAHGIVPRYAPLAFTANDSFDVGRDSYSPVSPKYFDRAPFKYNNVIKSVHIKYIESSPKKLSQK